MADVILFRPLSDIYGFTEVTLPAGLLYVSSYLLKEGYSVKIIDEIVDKSWKEITLGQLKQKPILVGISSITGKQLKYGLRFAKFIRQNSDIPIVWGGKHPTISPIQVLNNKLVDFVVKGEGEETTLELIKCLEKKKDFAQIEGLGFKKDGKIFMNPDRRLINLDDVPEIPYHLLNMKSYFRKTRCGSRTIEIYTSRGCPHNCKFCSEGIVHKRRWGTFSLDKNF